MSNKSSDEQSQKINSVILGSNNSTTLTQVVVNVNSHFANQESLVKQLKEENLCDGVHIMAIGAEENVPLILDAAGL